MLPHICLSETLPLGSDLTATNGPILSQFAGTFWLV